MWWMLWAMVTFFWVVTYFEGDVNWTMVSLGAVSMGVLVLWAMEMTGNKLPGSFSRDAGVNPTPEVDSRRIEKRPDSRRH
jgi:hypothetical protein